MPAHKSAQPRVNNSLHFRRFPIHEMKPYRVILVVGKRGSGKTTLIKTLLFEMRHKIEFVISYVGSQDTVNEFKEFIPECLIHTAWNPASIEILIKLQEIWKKMNMLQNPNGEYKDRSILVLFDDMQADKDWMKSKTIVDLHCNGRHYGITFINAAQYMMAIPTEIRSQVDYVFAFYDQRPQMQKRMYDQFFGGHFSYADFKNIYKKLTDGGRCMVLDNCSRDNDVTSCIYHFSAKKELFDPNFHFTFGSDVMWHLALKYSKTKLQALEEIKAQYGQLRNVLCSSAKTKSPKSGASNAANQSAPGLVMSDGTLVTCEDVAPEKSPTKPQRTKTAARTRPSKIHVDEDDANDATYEPTPPSRTFKTRNKNSRTIVMPAIRLDGDEYSQLDDDQMNRSVALAMRN